MKQGQKTAAFSIIFSLAACAHEPPSRPPPARSNPTWTSSFESAEELMQWRVEVGGTGKAAVKHVARRDGSLIEVVLGESGSTIDLRRRLDARDLRGQRVRLSVRARAQGAAVRAGLQARRLGPEGIADVAESRQVDSHHWTNLHALVDVASEASDLEVKLSAQGEGEAWFDDVRVVGLGRPDRASVAPRKLSAAERESLSALGRVLALVRYFHPSDESALLDWDAFAVTAVDRILSERNKDVHEIINELLRSIAPLTEIYRAGQKPMRTESLPLQEGKTTWWHHAGLGTGSPYLSLRAGRDEPESTGVVFVPVPPAAIAGCRDHGSCARRGTRLSFQ